MKIARVFPRRTNATPVDELAFIGTPDLFSPFMGIDRVHISVAFTWDIPVAEELAKEWGQIAPTEIGGPALGQPGEDFTPGMYLKKGYVITSRGCPNRCWFCSVWRREGDTLRELPVTEGWNVLDDNLLACSEAHIKSVFAMLARQKHRPYFTGGLEAARLQQWHIKELVKLNPVEIFFAYDTPNDREPLYEAGKMLMAAGFNYCHPLRAYVLIGYPEDTFEKAVKRLFDCISAGFTPMAMLYRDETGERDPAWIKFAWPWARPAVIYAKRKEAAL
ncbi:hypothetical protein FACS1894161_4480 [Spirochaetia bacterium]|nr:hypothetical protein FACS1894161_4480 [Spirochaetia bacterium]